MKKIIAMMSLGVYGCGALAQGYAGALIAFTKFNGGCEAGLSCGNKPLGMKVFAGTRLADDSVIQLGVGAVDTVEVGAFRMGSRNGQGITQVSITGGTQDAALTNRLTSDGLYIAAGAHMPIVEGLSFTPKLGVAYVTTSLKTWVNGVSAGNVSENHFAPYGSLGLEYLAPNDIRLTASVDVTRSKAQGVSTVSSLVGIGAAMGF